MEPGIKAVTFTSTRIDGAVSGEFDYIDPFEVIITDFSITNLAVESRGDVTNCLMASNPDIYCDSESGSGKRVKVWLTGSSPFDMTFQTTDYADSATVDYFNFGKVSNFTGARMTGFTIELRDANGDLMSGLDPANAVLFNLAATQIGLGARLPDGLFGAGGNEADIGFFSDDRAGLALTSSVDTLSFGALSNPEYVANFGTALVDDTMVPDGLFWDDNNDPTDESSLIAWDNIAGGGWTYGTLALDATALNVRLAELAGALGLDEAVITADYADGGLVSSEIVAAAKANGLFAVDPIEDLRNANLNYTLTIADVDGNEFTVRMSPEFAQIVEEAQTQYLFSTAGYLDAAANLPYWDLGNSALYKTTIEDILALDEAEQAAALASVGFSIAPAFSSLGFETARDQVAAISNMAPIAGGDERAKSYSGAQSWLMGGDLYGLFTTSGSQSTYDATSSSIGYGVDALAFTAGIENRLNERTSFGIALGAVNATAEANGGLGEVDLTGLTLTAFMRSQMESGVSVQALLGYQDLSYDSTRSVLGSTATGSTNGSQLFGALQADYLRDVGGFRMGPTASIEFYDISVDGFTETGAGAFNMTIADQSSNTVLGSIGVLGEYQLPSGNGVLTGSVEYTVVSGSEIVVGSGFAGLPSVSYPVQGLSDNLIDVALGFESVLSSNASSEVALRAGYGGSFGDNYARHGVQLGINIQF